MLIGVGALVQFPGLENSEQAFPVAMMASVPPGLRALVMVAILAAIASSGDASVNSATALVVNDVFKRYLLRGRSDIFYLRLSQVSCLTLGAVALTLALLSPVIVGYIRLGFLIRTPVAITILVGLYWRGANALGAVAAIVSGTTAVLVWHTFGNTETLDPFWIGAPITFLTLYAVSVIFRRPLESTTVPA